MLFRLRKPGSDDFDHTPVNGYSEDDRVAEPEPLHGRGAAPEERARAMVRPKGQLTSSDVRTDRLVRQVRQEIEQLRCTLEELSEGQDELLDVDIDAIRSDPEAAATLPPALLVRALIASADREQALREERDAREAELARLREEHAELELDTAGMRSRLQTLEEVIAALHANLEDFRFAREHGGVSVNGPVPRYLADTGRPELWNPETEESH